MPILTLPVGERGFASFGHVPTRPFLAGTTDSFLRLLEQDSDFTVFKPIKLVFLSNSAFLRFLFEVRMYILGFYQANGIIPQMGAFVY